MCFQLHQGQARPLPQALPKWQLGSGLSWAGGASLAAEVRPFRVLREVGQKFFLPAGNNTGESASYPFY